MRRDEDPAGRLEELAAVSAALVAAGHEAGDGGFGVDELLAGEAVGAHGGVQGRHEQRGGDPFAADVADGDADAGHVAAAAGRRGPRSWKTRKS